ncbi:MAG TPA: acyl-CoA desaturase [Ferruginibacter sp.]|nr:acyl-CoA desaturase [Ferruginibacter sp.]HMP22262.1 acyl-CoA desaturase [Ferruginibacter sp.]
MSTPKFLHSSSNFHTELKRRVNQYFEELQKPSTGNFKLFFKAIFLTGSYAALYVHLVYFTPPVWLALLECVLLGCFTAAVGFNVMHDGAHGSFSKSKAVNKLAAVSVNFLGASYIMWCMKHNIIHHTYTNIDGVDDDIEIKPYLRMCPTQKHHKIHRFQHYYVWFLYSLLHLFWVFASDYKKYFSGKIGTVPIRKMTLREHIAFWAAKIIYAVLFMVIPIIKLGFLPWLIGFLTASLVTGFIISVVFQLAHTVEETAFPLPTGDTNKIENEWAIHQVLTTANFATKNKLICWLVGGLNFQIEHHLFPRISHVHYPAISKIIKQTCEEFNIKYNEFDRMRHAIISHVLYLRKMGRLA